jgi:hypothetical protein
MGLFEVVEIPKGGKRDKTKAGKHLAWMQADSTQMAAQLFAKSTPKSAGKGFRVFKTLTRSKKTGRFNESGF